MSIENKTEPKPTTDCARFLIDQLGLPPIQRNQFMRDARDVHIRTIDQIFNLIQSQSKGKGVANFGTIWLAGKSIDDLNCAFHLAQQGYMAQAYSLLRSVLESEDLIELFHKDPAEADKWAEDDSPQLRTHFRAGNVRKRLGKPEHDSLYSFFCGHGSHPRFEGRHLTSYMKVDPEAGSKKLQFNVGGKHWIKDVYGSHLYTLFLGQILLLQVWQHFGHRISDGLAGKALLTLDNTGQFLEAHLPEMAKQIFTKEGQEHIQQMVDEMKQAFAGASALAKELIKLGIQKTCQN